MYANALEETNLKTTLEIWRKPEQNIILTPKHGHASMAVSHMLLLCETPSKEIWL